ncbi:MAG: D-alanine--D-alanine ligase family protein [Candidatus Nanopelagicales bacterium]
MEQQRKTRVAVVFGGCSSEHAISCVSAGSVLAAIDREKYEVVPVGITKDGTWVLEADEPERLRIVEGRLPAVDDSGERVYVPVDVHRSLACAPGEEVSVSEPTGISALAKADVVFPALHGPWGEDGTIQGLLELAGIPYVGSGVFASAAAMDKAHMKAMLGSAGLKVGPYELITDRQWRTDQEGCLQRIAALGSPVFVKPARAGSSVGISKVSGGEPAKLVEAIETARTHDPRVVVEAGFAGVREVECGVLDGPEGPRASVCAEIVVHPDHEFYDFNAKYLEDAVDLVVPADLPAEVSESVRDQAVIAFQALDCEGLARVDFFITPEGEAIVNEVNTMPGFTSISMFPRMWEHTGLSYPALIDHLISDALRRGVGLR